MSCASDVAALIDSLLTGTTYYSHEPADPSATLTTTVYDTGGDAGLAYVGKYDPTIQVRVRAVDYNTGYDRAAAIRDALLPPTNVNFGGWVYTGFWLVSDVAHIGNDDRDRSIFTVNFQIMREQ